MKKIYTLTILVIILNLSSCSVFLQNSGLKNYKLKSQIDRNNLTNYQYDFIYLIQFLDKGFPNIDSVFPQKSRDSLKSIIIKKLSNQHINDIDFIIQTRKYLSQFHNQHTNIRLTSEFEKKFPYIIHIYQNKWYLLNVETKQDSLLISKQITRINNIDISDVENRLIKFTFAENKINQQDDLKKLQLYNKPEYLKEIGVINNVDDSLRITFEDSSYIWLNPLNKENRKYYKIKYGDWGITKYKRKPYFYEAYPTKDFAYLQYNRCNDKIDILDAIESYIKPWLQSFTIWYVKRLFKKDPPSKHIVGIYNSEYPIFKDFVWELVDSCNKNNIKNLIIDLRNNPGGNLILGKQLIYFLSEQTQLNNFKDYAYTSDVFKEYFREEYNNLKKEYGDTIPDNKLILVPESNILFSEITNKESVYFISQNRPVFKGKVYVLANYRTGSAAAMLTTLLQDNGLATIIGTSVGNNATGATTWTPFKLPKTKAVVSIATTYKERPNEEAGKIQVPDYWIEYSINDLQNGIDPFLEKTIDLIEHD